MRCITLWEPWATLWITGKKRFETRHWATAYRGDLLVHAASRPARRDEFSLAILVALGLPESMACTLLNDRSKFRSFARNAFSYGCILGKVNLTDCCPTSYTSSWSIFRQTFKGEMTDHGYFEKVMEPECHFGNFAAGRFVWDGGDRRLKFRTPIPYKGRQNFFNIPNELVAEQLAAAIRVNLCASMANSQEPQ